MTDVRQTQYIGDTVTVLSTELNSLVDNTWVALSAEQTNSLGYMFMDLQVDLGSALPVGADATIEIYIVPSVDGATYPTVNFAGVAAEQENNQYFVGSVSLSVDTEAHIHNLPEVQVPRGKWKMAARNTAGVTLAASGNSIKARYWGYQSV